MPECCQPYIQSFVGADEVIIAYSPAMLANFGSRPRVDVLIQDETTGEFVIQDFMIRKSLSGSPDTTAITVNMGGPATGLIKVS